MTRVRRFKQEQFSKIIENKEEKKRQFAIMLNISKYIHNTESARGPVHLIYY